MQNFDWTSFTLKIAINASAETLFGAWCKSGEVEKWFLESCIYRNENANLEPNENAVQGNSYRWKWFVYDDIENGKILASNPARSFSFTFAGDCKVEVRFTESFGQTIVTLTQSDIPTDDASKKNIRLGCHDGWSFYLYNLKSVYEGGVDLRNKDERFGILINN